MACDIQNTHLTADFRDQVWVAAGPDFGSEAGKNMLMKKALYGLNSSGAAFRAFLVDTLDALGYRPSYSETDLCLRLAVKIESFEYYEYIFCYVDGVLCLSPNSQK